MDFNEAKSFLKNEYIKNGFEFVKEDSEKVMLKYDKYFYNIWEEDINNYLEFKNKKIDFKKTPNECSLMIDDYREQALYNLDDKGYLYYFSKYQFLNEDNTIVLAEISPATNYYFNEFRFDKDFLSYSFANLKKGFNALFSQNTIQLFAADIRSEFKAPITIKLYKINNTFKNKISYTDSIINSCLFNLSYFKDIPLAIRNKWSYKSSPIKEFDIKKKFADTNLPFSKLRYNEDLIMFYKEALCTTKVVLKFLAYYHILEYHFTKVTYAKLFKKMRNVIKNPEFTSSNDDLNNLLQNIKEQKIPDAELKCLENVIDEYVDKRDLQNFLKAYEKELGENRYSNELFLFGQKIKISDSIELVSKVIYTVRNAIVHSDDLNSSKIKHIPFSESEKEIQIEIPLIKYLAEKVIIATSKDM